MTKLVNSEFLVVIVYSRRCSSSYRVNNTHQADPLRADTIRHGGELSITLSIVRASAKLQTLRMALVMRMNRSSYRYVGIGELVDEGYRLVQSLSYYYPYWGYRKIYDLMKADGLCISRERVRLIRRREGLQVLRRRKKRKLLGTTTRWVNRANYPNHVWSYDFIFDRTEDARQLKCLTVVDEFTRQGFEITVGRSLTASDVIRVLDKLFLEHGRPACLRSDNGPEMVSIAVQKWLKDKHVATHYIDPGSPWHLGTPLRGGTPTAKVSIRSFAPPVWIAGCSAR